MSTHTKPLREPIYGLDLVRFAAASAVLFFHLGFLAFAAPLHASHRVLSVPPYPSAYLPSWTAETWWGWIGVQVFFVISGVVIAYSAEGADPMGFFRARMSRLVPMMFVCATIMALVDLTWTHEPAGQVAYGWLWSVTFNPFGGWLCDQIWTLPIEITFYGVVGLMIARGLGDRLEGLAWFLCLISAAYCGACMFGRFADHWPVATRLLLLPHGVFFALGILLSVVDRKGLDWRRLLLGLLCICTAGLQIALASQGQHLGYGLDGHPMLPLLAWGAAIAAIAASLYWKTKIARLLGRWAHLFRVMGLATYPLYLIQMHVGGPVLALSVAHGVPTAAGLIAAYVASVGGAVVIALVLEPMVQRYLNNKRPRAKFAIALAAPMGAQRVVGSD